MIRLKIYHARQDDPKKCTARKMARYGFATLYTQPDKIRKGILLDPFADTALSMADLDVAKKWGIVALDCSWALAEEVFSVMRKRLVPRALPYLLAANPVN